MLSELMMEPAQANAIRIAVAGRFRNVNRGAQGIERKDLSSHIVIISATIGAILLADPNFDALQRVWPFSFARLGARAKGLKR